MSYRGPIQKAESWAPAWVGNAVMIAAALGVGYVVWGLAAENRALKAEISQLRAGVSPLGNGYTAGDLLPDTLLVGLNGEQATLAGLAQRGGVIAFLTTTCPWCEATLPTWSGIAERYAQQGVPFAAVSFHDAAETAAYAAEHGIDWPLWVVDPIAAAEIKVESVPTTILIGADGVVRRSWNSALQPEDAEIITAALGNELSADRMVLSGSPANDPDCCEETALISTSEGASR